MKRTSMWLGALLWITTACEPAEAPRGPRAYRLITHLEPSASFWPSVFEGARDAAEERGAEAEFYGLTTERTPPAEQQAEMIRQAIADRVDGIALTVTDPAVLSAPVNEAVAAGIPVIAFNIYVSPEERETHDLPLSGYVGSIETETGLKAALHGRDLALERGAVVDSALCIKAMNDARWAVQRCESMTSALTPLGVEVTTLGGDFYAQPPLVPEAEITAWFAAHPEVDFVFSTGPAVLSLLLAQRSDGTIAESVVIGSMDLDEATLEAIRSGTIAFSVDQQPYLQGYLSIMLLDLEDAYLLRASDALQTAPFFVEASNVDEIARLIRDGVR